LIEEMAAVWCASTAKEFGSIRLRVGEKTERRGIRFSRRMKGELMPRRITYGSTMKLSPRKIYLRKEELERFIRESER